MNKDKKELIKRLKTNPVYSMSLGGKELFHSNMLTWLLMRDNNNPIKIMFGIEEKEVVLNVFRERQNLDLIIVYANKEELEKEDVHEEQYVEMFDDPDSYLPKNDVFNKLKFIIIENKFKSIPEQTQLAEYSNKLNHKKIKVYKRTIENDKTRCYLFAPTSILNSAIGLGTHNAENSYIIEDVEWKTVTYEEFSNKLEEIVDDSCEGTVIEYYKDMLINLLIILSEWLIKDIGKGLSTPDEENIKLLKQIRFYDIYTKLWYGMTQKRIEEKLKGIKQPDRRYFGMTRSFGLCEWKYEYNEELLVGVQIQNNNFRVFVEPYYKKKPKEKLVFPGTNNKKERFTKAICTWGGGILNKVFEPAQEEYKYLKFDNFKYVQRAFIREMSIDVLSKKVVFALNEMSKNGMENISSLYENIKDDIVEEK